MNIYLRTRTSGKGGEKLKGNLIHIDKFIQNALAEAAFETSFDTFWIMFAYPLPDLPEGNQDEYSKYFASYPHLKLKRKQKEIELSMYVPEIAEHQEKQRAGDETDLARRVIDRFIEAGELIAARAKKEDRFPLPLFKETLMKLKSTITAENLATVNKQNAKQVKESRLDDAIAHREERAANHRLCDTPIRDLRLYTHGLLPKTLYPYDYQYSAIFLQMLKEVELTCPGYHHLYIQAATSQEAALLQSRAIEDWYVNGIAVFDLEAYKNMTDADKAETVFNLIVEGLMDIATIDGLDKKKIHAAIEAVREKGLETELMLKIIDHKNYTLMVTCIARSMEEGSPIFFNLYDKRTERRARVPIGSATHFQIGFWLQKITITNKQIRVRSSSSIAASVWLEGKPTSMDFDIGKMFEQQ